MHEVEKHLTNRQLSNGGFVELKLLLPKSLPRVQELQNRVSAEVGRNQYVPLEDQYVDLALRRGWALGAEQRGRLVGASIGFGDQEEADLFGPKVPKDINLVDGNFLCFTGIVGADQRGNGIARELLRQSIEQARVLGKSYCITTVAPHNGPSLKVVLDCGFKISYLGPVYGEQVRVVAWLDIGSKLDNGDYGNLTWIDSTDINKQIDFLSAGRQGVRARRGQTASNTEIGYATIRAISN